MQARGLAYPCGCTRKAIETRGLARGVAHVPEAERVDPGTCRPERDGLQGQPPRALRFKADGPPQHWQDRRLGALQQDVAGCELGFTAAVPEPGTVSMWTLAPLALAWRLRQRAAT